MEHLVVRQMRAERTREVVEEGRHVGQPLVDPRQLARVRVVVDEVLELVGDDALIRC